MSVRAASVALLSALALCTASGVRAQVGDPPPPPDAVDELPPPPPLEDTLADPADVAPVAPPSSALPPPPPSTPAPLPPPDPPLVDEAVCPSAPAWPIAAAASGLAGGLTLAAAGSGLLALSWASETSSDPTGFVPVALLVGATTLPFLAGLGAGLAVLPLGRPVLLRHFVELCGACAASWALSLCIVGAAFTGGGGGCGSPSCGSGGSSCDDPFDLGDDDGYRVRTDVYWAAVGAGLGAIAGATVAWLGSYGLKQPTVEVELVDGARVIGGAAFGSLVLGAIAGGYGAMEYAEELEASEPPACRPSSSP